MAITDEQIKQGILEQFDRDSRVKGSEIELDTQNGTVKLSGKVPYHSARKAAEDIAKAIPGVLSVQNRINILYPTKVTFPSDQEIKENLSHVLEWNPYIDESAIQIGVGNGVVKITGSTDSFWKKERVEEIAFDISGVVDVINELVVAPTENFRDQEIGNTIISSLDKNPDIDATEVDAEVTNGKVTLRGRVSNRHAYQIAVDSARYAPGVKNVINEMRIED
jgi:osmotically-inducible protein OsmY